MSAILHSYLWGFWSVVCGWKFVALVSTDGVKEASIARSASPDASADGTDTRPNDTRSLSTERERESKRRAQTRKVLLPRHPSPPSVSPWAAVPVPPPPSYKLHSKLVGQIANRTQMAGDLVARLRLAKYKVRT